MKNTFASTIIACLLALPASAQVRLSDFEGVWERAGPGPGGPQDRAQSAPNGTPGRAPQALDGAVTFRLGAPSPEQGRGPPIPEADAALGLDAGDLRIRRLMTAAGRARFAAFRPIEHPMYNCITPGLPSVAGMPGRQSWTVDNDTIRISHETWPEPRTTTLLAEIDPTAPHTRMGQSTARIDNGALVITTTSFTEAWAGLGRNAPGSAERMVVETYRLAGADRIEGDIVITDPLFLTEPLRRAVMLRRASAGTVIEEFPCDLEASQRLIQSQ